MTALRAGLPPLPEKMQGLPIDERGFPVPFFVAYIDGKPDHRVADSSKMPLAIRENRCWMCGHLMGVYKSFVIGPMCAITNTISEPPSHKLCARYACTACPFLTRPHAHRRDAGMPEGGSMPGIAIMRNPGAMCIWTTKHYDVERERGGFLFHYGPAVSTEWYAEGRPATRAEVQESIDSGLPELLKHIDPKAAAEWQRAELNKRLARLGAMLDKHNWGGPYV